MQKRIFYGLFALSLFAPGALFNQSVSAASRIVVKDSLQVQRAVLYNEALCGGHDCYNPNISGCKADSVTATTARISWKTNVKSTYQVRYGLTSSSKPNLVPASRTAQIYTFYAIWLTGLKPNTKYYYNGMSWANDGATRISGTYNFTTLPATTSVLENSSQASSNAISEARIIDMTAKEVTFSWKTNFPSTSYIEYGLTTEYGSKSDVNSQWNRFHIGQLFNLPLGTTYYARAASTDATGKTVYSADLTFKTPAAETRIVDRSNIFIEPNPCFEKTAFIYYLYQPVKRVTIDIVTLSGKMVAALEVPSSNLKEGKNRVTWDVRDNSGNRLPEGLYVYQLKLHLSDYQVETVKSTIAVRKNSP